MKPKYYELGRFTARFTELRFGLYRVIIKEDGKICEDYVFHNKESALEEILSFAEMDEDDWVEEE